jgi:hypothetical protein
MTLHAPFKKEKKRLTISSQLLSSLEAPLILFYPNPNYQKLLGNILHLVHTPLSNKVNKDKKT